MDIVLRLLEKAGDHVSDDIWHRVVQLVTNNQDMQHYAARNIVGVLQRGAQDEVCLCVNLCVGVCAACLGGGGAGENMWSCVHLGPYLVAWMIYEAASVV